MTEGAGGNDSGVRAGMTKGKQGRRESAFVMPDVFNCLLSFPTFLIGNPWGFSV